jgi:TolA-binding protein
MSIGDVCPKESEEPPQAQDQPSSSMQASPPTQMRMRLKMMKEKIKRMSHLKRRAMIKGEMLIIKTRKMNKFKDRHTQESTKQ